ncbi:hypothetical protein Goshw_029331 [Gossypium schwendimanii]|uniref:Uncharacterized protein n=1 Tax=Gossypium schwendimanii TaxID=34291 RepID=A0A7J9LD35_GOSSC|nr:hypothetical protein [Gossypium schwendimanii]
MWWSGGNGQSAEDDKPDWVIEKKRDRLDQRKRTVCSTSSENAFSIERERIAFLDFRDGLKDRSAWLSSWVGKDCCLEKAAINRIFLILLSQKEEREIIFPFCKNQEIGSSRKKNAWLINNSLLDLQPTQSNINAPDLCNEMCLFIYLLTRNGSRGEQTLGEHSRMESCMLRSGRMHAPEKESIHSLPIGWTIVEYISYPLSGWAVKVEEGQSLIFKTKELYGGKLSVVPGSLVAGSSRTTRIIS